MINKTAGDNSVIKYAGILLFGLIPLLSCGTKIPDNMSEIKLNHEYEIFEHRREYSLEDTEKDIITVNYELIQSLPESVKVIIARYSTFLPDYMLTKEESGRLAKSLGNFSSLQKAQMSYLKIWGEDFTVLNEPVCLTMKRTETALIFTYGFVYGTDYVCDEFTINGNGKITQISSEKKNRFN